MTLDPEEEYQASLVTLLARRAQAIDAYAAVESELKNLLTGLIDINHKQAAIIFYRMMNSRARNAMFQDLIAIRYPEFFKPYWASMLKFITDLDAKRNRIVHWHIGGRQTFDDGKEFKTRIEPAMLNPTNENFFPIDDEAPNVDAIDLLDFIRRAYFAANSINVFWFFAGGKFEEFKDEIGGDAPTWRETFLQRPAYPPPAAHPLSRLMQESESLRSPSRA
jgi:hypothetical protein